MNKNRFSGSENNIPKLCWIFLYQHPQKLHTSQIGNLIYLVIKVLACQPGRRCNSITYNLHPPFILCKT